LVFAISPYCKTLAKTQGLIAEFINPKYKDSTKTEFKSPTRLECMMQDYPKLLGKDSRVGFTQVTREFCFSACKNDLKSAADKFKTGLSPECAGSCEQSFYQLGADVLRLAGATVEFPPESASQVIQGIKLSFSPLIVLKPSFGVTLDEIRAKIRGRSPVFT
jgi:UDP-sugar pyrophosphorylase